MIAALFVLKDGPYFGVRGVSPWGKFKDARDYPGPYPVVAHPPCQRWGKYWRGGPNSKKQLKKGDDGGCFESALADVRQWGGVLEHPAHSRAWPHFGLTKPPKEGGWVRADDHGGWTCSVEQGHYGHLARKATWLYAVGTKLPDLHWGPSNRKGIVDGGPLRALYPDKIILTKSQRTRTPLLFRRLLCSLARSVHTRKQND